MQFCPAEEQTGHSQNPFLVYRGQYPCVAPGVSAQLELTQKREVSGVEAERKIKDFYKASKEVRQQMNLLAKGQNWGGGESCTHADNWLLLWDMREMWEIPP